MPRSQPRITEALQHALQKSFALAKEARHEFLTLEHLLLALQEDPLVKAAVEACGGKIQGLASDLETFLRSHLEVLPEALVLDPLPTLGFNRVLERAILHAISSESPHVDGGAVLAALLLEKESHAAYFLQQHGVTRLPLLKHLAHGAGEAAPVTPAPAPAQTEEGEEAPARDPLQAYAVDLVQKAAEGRIDPLIGREAELERLIHVLCRRRKNNPLLVGETGVGKTAIAEGLALRLLDGQVPEALKGVPFFSLDMGALLAGTRYRGDFEQRVKAVLEALAAKPGALLFIDEIHTLVGAGSVSGGTMDASNLLKPVLASGELRCIGATTYQDVKASFDRDRPLARRFQKIEVSEPTRGRQHRHPQGPAGSLRGPPPGQVLPGGHRGRGAPLGAPPAGPAPAGQGHRCAGRGRCRPEAAARPEAPEGHRRRRHRERGGAHGAGAHPHGELRRPHQAGLPGAGSPGGALRPGPGHRPGLHVHQALPVGPAGLRPARWAASSSQAPRGSARPSWPGSWRCSPGCPSCASTCPSTWRSTP